MIKKIVPFVLGVLIAGIVVLALLSFNGVVLVPQKTYDRYIVLEEKYDKIEDIEEDILDKFYLEITEEQIYEGMIRGMFDATDDKYTTYMNPEEFKEYGESTNGNYVGIGVLSDVSDDQIEITRVFKSSPAEAGGILPGDFILQVDDFHIDDHGYEHLIDVMLGEEDTPIKVIVSRDEEIIEFDLMRGRVEIPFVDSTIIDDYGYIMIYQFGTDVSDEFDSHLEALLDQDIKGLILDVRNNPGGLVNESTEIADELMGKGVIIYTLDNKGNRREYKSDVSKLDIPIVCLGNENSASASEILLGAIQDSDTAEVVGVQTFGKGIIQGISSLRDGSGYKITFSQYFTPSDKAIHGVGILPDYIVEYEGIIDGETPNSEIDLQLKKAIDLLDEKLLSN